MLLPSDARGLGQCRRRKCFAESAETACSKLHDSAFQTMRCRVYIPRGEREWEGDRWKTGSLEPEDRRVRLLLAARSTVLGRLISELGRMSHSRWDGIWPLVSLASQAFSHYRLPLGDSLHVNAQTGFLAAHKWSRGWSVGVFNFETSLTFRRTELLALQPCSCDKRKEFMPKIFFFLLSGRP